jgi:hypothetical protein
LIAKDGVYFRALVSPCHAGWSQMICRTANASKQGNKNLLG